MNIKHLLSVLAGMAATADAPADGPGGDPDAAIRGLYSHYAKTLHDYAEQFCPDRASADDIVQETFIRAWWATGIQLAAALGRKLPGDREPLSTITRSTK